MTRLNVKINDNSRANRERVVVRAAGNRSLDEIIR